MSRLHAPWFAQHGAATSGEAVVLAASLLNRRPASRILLKQRSGDLRLHLGLADHGVQVVSDSNPSAGTDQPRLAVAGNSVHKLRE